MLVLVIVLGVHALIVRISDSVVPTISNVFIESEKTANVI